MHHATNANNGMQVVMTIAWNIRSIAKNEKKSTKKAKESVDLRGYFQDELNKNVFGRRRKKWWNGFINIGVKFMP